jgi:hypothetical protein
MAARRCPLPCGKIIYTSRRAAHRGMGKLTNQFAYWDPGCKTWHTSSTRTAVRIRPWREIRSRRRAA